MPLHTQLLIKTNTGHNPLQGRQLSHSQTCSTCGECMSGSHASSCNCFCNANDRMLSPGDLTAWRPTIHCLWATSYLLIDHLIKGATLYKFPGLSSALPHKQDIIGQCRKGGFAGNWPNAGLAQNVNYVIMDMLGQKACSNAV